MLINTKCKNHTGDQPDLNKRQMWGSQCDVSLLPDDGVWDKFHDQMKEKLK